VNIVQLSIIQIGNSKGIRIPKAILDKCQIENEVDMEVHDGRIIIERRRGNPRQGWDEAFERMAENGDDAMLIDDSLDLDLAVEDWEW
jgi:antitoxin MazE